MFRHRTVDPPTDPEPPSPADHYRRASRLTEQAAHCLTRDDAYSHQAGRDWTALAAVHAQLAQGVQPVDLPDLLAEWCTRPTEPAPIGDPQQ